MQPNEFSPNPHPEQVSFREALATPEQMTPQQIAREVGDRLKSITTLRRRFIASRSETGSSSNVQKAAT